MKEENRKSNDRIKKLEVFIETKADQIDLDEVKTHLKMLPTTDEIKLMQTGMRATLDVHGRK